MRGCAASASSGRLRRARCRPWQLARQDWTDRPRDVRGKRAPDVGAYEEIRGCGQKLVPTTRWAANLEHVLGRLPIPPVGVYRQS